MEVVFKYPSMFCVHTKLWMAGIHCSVTKGSNDVYIHWLLYEEGWTVFFYQLVFRVFFVYFRDQVQLNNQLPIF